MSKRSCPAPRRLAIGAALVSVPLIAGACGGGGDGTTVQGVKLVKKGRLTTCTHLPYRPFQFEQGGKVVGFDVDMIDLVAKRLGVTQKVIDTPFETIKTGSALNAGTCDVSAAGMTIKPDRAKLIDFSQPYFEATQALMAAKGSGVASLGDVKAKKLRLAAQASTTGEDYVREQGFDPKSYKDSADLLNGLRTRQSDVIVEDYPVVHGWLKDPANGAYAIVARLNTGERYGFAVRKGHNPRLLELIDQTIQTARRDGTYKRIYEKWIGPMPAGA